jgi:OCT family organic cation transporter-like MFS transporter 4/5
MNDNDTKEKLLEVKNFDLNKAIQEAGDYNLYQYLNLFFLSLVWIIVPSISIMLPFFRMMPTRMCQDNVNGVLSTRVCTLEEICDDKIIKIDSDDPLKTWASDFNLYCDKSMHLNSISTMYLIGILVGNLFISKFTDTFGRKPVLKFYLILYLCTSILTVMAWNYTILYIVTFTVGILYSGTTMCAFIINYESSNSERKVQLSTFLSASLGIGAIAHIVIFYYFKRWYVTVLITSVITVILLCFTYHLQESPEFLYMKHRYKELIQVLRYIAKQNGRNELLENYLEQTEFLYSRTDVYVRNNSYGIIDIFTFDADSKIRLLVISFNWFVMTLTFYGIDFNVGMFGINPYITGIIVYASETVSQFVGLLLIRNFGFTYTLSTCYSISSICLILLNIYMNTQQQILNISLLILAKFGISALVSTNYIYTADMFDVEIRVASIAFCSLSSRLGSLIGASISREKNNMLIQGLLCLANAVLVFSIKKKYK